MQGILFSLGDALAYVIARVEFWKTQTMNWKSAEIN